MWTPHGPSNNDGVDHTKLPYSLGWLFWYRLLMGWGRYGPLISRSKNCHTGGSFELEISVKLQNNTCGSVYFQNSPWHSFLNRKLDCLGPTLDQNLLGPCRPSWDALSTIRSSSNSASTSGPDGYGCNKHTNITTLPKREKKKKKPIGSFSGSWNFL